MSKEYIPISKEELNIELIKSITVNDEYTYKIYKITLECEKYFSIDENTNYVIIEKNNELYLVNMNESGTISDLVVLLEGQISADEFLKLNKYDKNMKILEINREKGFNLKYINIDSKECPVFVRYNENQPVDPAVYGRNLRKPHFCG